MPRLQPGTIGSRFVMFLLDLEPPGHFRDLTGFRDVESDSESDAKGCKLLAGSFLALLFPVSLDLADFGQSQPPKSWHPTTH